MLFLAMDVVLKKTKNPLIAFSRLPAGCDVQHLPVQQHLRGPGAAAALAGIHPGAG